MSASATQGGHNNTSKTYKSPAMAGDCNGLYTVAQAVVYANGQSNGKGKFQHPKSLKPFYRL